jgi:hypothetical protein
MTHRKALLDFPGISQISLHKKEGRPTYIIRGAENDGLVTAASQFIGERTVLQFKVK